MNNIRILYHILIQSIRGSLSYRFDFFMQIFMMLVNNLFLFLNIYFFFSYQGSILGVTYAQYLGQIAYLSVFFGIFYFAFVSMTELHHYISNGSFDAVLLTPGNPAFTFLAKETHPASMGDVITGLVIGCFVFTPIQYGAMLLLSILAVFVSIGFSILFASSAFFLKGRGNVWDSFFLIFIATGLYPKEAFDTSILRYILYTVVPVGIVTYGPTEFLRTWNIQYLIPFFVGGIIVWTLGLIFFNRGIKSYESGNLSVKSI